MPGKPSSTASLYSVTVSKALDIASTKNEGFSGTPVDSGHVGLFSHSGDEGSLCVEPNPLGKEPIAPSTKIDTR